MRGIAVSAESVTPEGAIRPLHFIRLPVLVLQAEQGLSKAVSLVGCAA